MISVTRRTAMITSDGQTCAASSLLFCFLALPLFRTYTNTLNVINICCRYRAEHFDLDRIFIPINPQRDHWVCAVIYMQKRRSITTICSMGTTVYLKYIYQYIQDEHQDKKREPMSDAHQWILVARNEWNYTPATEWYAFLSPLFQPG
jgi:hypothetical protein